MVQASGFYVSGSDFRLTSSTMIYSYSVYAPIDKLIYREPDFEDNASRLAPIQECDVEPVVEAQGSTDIVEERAEWQSRLQARKKPIMCVRFADDCGQLLKTVRVMTEPSDHPPKVSSAVILRHRMAAADGAMMEGGGEKGVDHGSNYVWRVGFKQPASEYVKFRETLQQQKVLREETCRMVGTVKVVNVGLVKRVFVRYTTDGWRSYLDQPATLQPSPRSKTFDTFYFEVNLPNSGVEVQRVGSQHSANNLHNHLECSNGLLRLLYCQRDRRILGFERGPKLPTALQLVN